MKPVLLVYATREGQTRRICEHLAATLRARDVNVDVVDAAHPPSISFERYGNVVLAASVHAGKHEREMVAFAKRHRQELARTRIAFLSVSLSEVTSHEPNASPAVREEATKAVRQVIDDFVAETELHPAAIQSVAGALLYRQYGFLKRFVMRQIVRKNGGPTDTSRDYEYTDWAALDAFADSLHDE